MFTFNGAGTVKKVTTNTGEHTSRHSIFIEAQRPDRNGEPVTVHLPVVYWGTLNDNIRPGASIEVTGYLTRPKKTSKRGTDYYQLELTATDITVRPDLDTPEEVNV